MESSVVLFNLANTLRTAHDSDKLFATGLYYACNEWSSMNSASLCYTVFATRAREMA